MTVTKTPGVVLLAPTQVAASTVTLGGVIDVSAVLDATARIHFGRRAAAAAGAPCNLRVEGSVEAAGDGFWVPLALFQTKYAAVESEAVSGAFAAGATAITVASTTNLTAGDLIHIDQAAAANSEFARIKSIVANTSVTVEDPLVNAATGATLYDDAELFLAKLDLLSVARIRLVADAALFTQNCFVRADMVTGAIV